MAHKILLADDHAVVREGLRRLLEASEDLKVVGEAGDGEKAVQLAIELKPDLALVDLSMPGMDGIEVTRLIAEKAPTVKVLILTMHANEEYAVRVLHAGARGFIGKGAEAKDLIGAVQKVLQGGTYLPPELLSVLPGRIAAAGEESPVGMLSDRELQVLKMLAEGRSPREIALAFHIAERTVATYRARLLEKLHLHSTVDLIRFALRHRLIEDAL